MLGLLAAIIVTAAVPTPCASDPTPPLAFERTVIDLGPVSDDQPIKQPFKFVYTGVRAGKLRFEHCHFCPTPESDRPKYVSGQEGFVLLELATQGKYGDAEATTIVAVEGEPGSRVELLLKASVRPRIMVRPDFLKIPELPRDRGGEATMTVVSRRRDLEVKSVRTESPFVEASVGPARDMDDLGDNCRAVPINIRIKPGLPLGNFEAVVQAETNDAGRPLIGCSIEAEVVGDLAAFPATASSGVLAPSQRFATGFTLSSRSGRALWYGSVKLAFKAGPRMPACTLDVEPGEDLGTLRVWVYGTAPSSPIVQLDGTVIVTTEDETGTVADELRVPVRLSVRGGRMVR